MTDFLLVYHLRDKAITLDELVSRVHDFAAELADPEIINEAWLHARMEGRTVFECQPYSIAEFLSVMMECLQPLANGKVIWLNMLEASLAFIPTNNTLEIRNYHGISSCQIPSFLGAEVAPGLCFELNCSRNGLAGISAASRVVYTEAKAWPRLLLHWARQFRDLVAKTRRSGNLARTGRADGSQEVALHETETLLAKLPIYEAQIGVILSS